MIAPAATATETQVATEAVAANETQIPLTKGACLKNGSVSGVARIGTKRPNGAKVRIFAASKSDPKGSFSKELDIQGSGWTNSQGGFYFSVACLPKEFVVNISGGRVAGKLSKISMSGLGRSDEASVFVTPATTVAVKFAKMNKVDAKTAVKRVQKFMKTIRPSSEVKGLGSATAVRSKTFSPIKFLKAASKAGSISKLAANLAKRAVKKNARRGFHPKNYVMQTRPGFPQAGSAGSPRTQAAVAKQARKSTKGSSVATSVLNSVAGKAAYNTTCALLPPSPTTNLVCANPDADALNEIANQLSGISQQLDELQTSVNDISAQLDVMGDQLNEIQSQLNVIQQEVVSTQQQTLQTQANQANSDYTSSYNNAGIDTVFSYVNAALDDLQTLGPIEILSTTWPTVAPGSTSEAICGTMYSSGTMATTDGVGVQDPLDICANFLDRINGFAGIVPGGSSTPYYTQMYQALVGSSSSAYPNNNKLIWAFQNSLAYGNHAPLDAATISMMQSTYGQLGQLMDTAYALLAAAQFFEYGATSGLNMSCSGLTTSGSFPANTVINVATACKTLQSGLFAAAVHNQMATKIAVPPKGAVADPRTNYVWWGYAADISASTMGQNSSYPFYPGADAGTYTTATGSPLSLQKFTNCCQGSGSYVAPTTSPMLPNSPSYTFRQTTPTQAQTLFNNLLLVDPNSVAATLNAVGFNGPGQNKFGMNWTNFGADPTIMSYQTKYYWQSSTVMPSNTKACTGYPATTSNFQCSAISNNYGYSWLTGVQDLYGVLAQNSWDLTTTTLPTSSNLTACPVLGTNSTYTGVYPTGVSSTVSAPICESNTFSFWLDTTAPAPNAAANGVLPPTWSPNLLVGPTSDVPALTVSQPVPAVSTS